MFIPFWIVICLTLFLIYLIDKVVRQYLKFKKRVLILSDIPGPTPEFFWGNVRQVSGVVCIFLTVCSLASSADGLCKTVWTQTRPDKMSGLIWVQTTRHSESTPERIFLKKLILTEKNACKLPSRQSV